MKGRRYRPGEDDPVAVYRAFLSGDIPIVFPGLWQDEAAARAILEYLWQQERISESDIPQVCDSAWFRQHRLRGLLDRYRGSPYYLLSTLYPGRWQPVQWQRIPHVADIRERALREQGIDPTLSPEQRINRTVTVRSHVLRRCRSCRSPLPEGWQRTLCPRCRKRVNAYAVAERRRRIEAGLCATMGCPHRPEPGRRRCKACRRAQLQHTKRWQVKRRNKKAPTST